MRMVRGVHAGRVGPRWVQRSDPGGRYLSGVLPWKLSAERHHPYSGDGGELSLCRVAGGADRKPIATRRAWLAKNSQSRLPTTVATASR
jgi:hypothetical protein